MHRPPDEKRHPGGGGVHDRSGKHADLGTQYTGRSVSATAVEQLIAEACDGAARTRRAEFAVSYSFAALQVFRLAEKATPALLTNPVWEEHRDRIWSEWEAAFEYWRYLDPCALADGFEDAIERPGGH